MIKDQFFASNEKIHNKLVSEASYKGLEIVGYSDKGPAHRLYRFVSCGHSQDILTSNVRKSHPRCSHCEQSSKLDIIHKSGLELISSVDNRRSLYRFERCGHTKEIDSANLRNGMFECKQCLYEENVKVANSKDLEIIGDSELGSLYKRYRFLGCGHVADLQKSNVRDGKVGCRVCREQSLKREAENSGIELIGESEKGARYRKYRFTCGHSSDMKTEMVRNGVCNCAVCGETSWSKPSYTYVFKIECDGFIWLKVGYARSLSFRKRRYGLAPNALITEVFVKRHETGKQADEHESKILSDIREYNIDRSTMLKYMTESGSTECFTLDALSKVEKFFK